MQSHHANISWAALKKHNDSTIRQWNVPRNNAQPLQNFPATQRSCKPSCQEHGCRTLSTAQRQTLYKQFFYRTADEKNVVQTMSTSFDEEKKKWSYFLPLNGANLSVCRTNFWSTYNVTSSSLGRLQKRKKEGDHFPRRMQGRHDNRPHRMPEDYKEAAVVHMNSYDRVFSHYSREHYGPDDQFLKPPLTIQQMYDEFIALHEDDGIDSIMSETTYRHLFHNRTNLKIGKYKSDTCDECESLHTSISHTTDPNELQALRQTQAEHFKKVEEARQELNKDRQRARENPNVHVLMVDAEKTLYTPSLSCKTAYFGTKFATHNLCINDEITNDPTMFLWSQTTAHLAANEVASCMLKYVTSRFEPLLEGEEREIIVWSDRCVAQNNNYHQLCLYSQLIKLGYCTSIFQKFLISGHSYNSCDSNFGLIEKKLRSVQVHYPVEFPALLRASRPSQPFAIVNMTQRDFYMLDRLMLFLKRPVTLKVTQNLAYKLEKQTPNFIFSKVTHEPFKPYNCHTLKFWNQLIDVNAMPLIRDCPAYTNGLIPIVGALRNDLLKIKRFLSPVEWNWYQNQLAIGQEAPNSEEEAELSGDE